MAFGRARDFEQARKSHNEKVRKSALMLHASDPGAHARSGLAASSSSSAAAPAASTAGSTAAAAAASVTKASDPATAAAPKDNEIRASSFMSVTTTSTPSGVKPQNACLNPGALESPPSALAGEGQNRVKEKLIQNPVAALFRVPGAFTSHNSPVFQPIAGAELLSAAPGSRVAFNGSVPVASVHAAPDSSGRRRASARPIQPAAHQPAAPGNDSARPELASLCYAMWVY